MIICCPTYFIHGLFLYNHYRSSVNHLMRNMAANLSITNKFDDYDSLAELFKRAGISETCIKRLMDEEGFEKPRDLATARDSDTKTTVETVNKHFGAKADNTRVYFPPIKIVRIQAISIYMNRCLMINQIPDVDLITYDKVLTFVNCLPTWTEKSSDTNDVVKSKSISFDPLKFKTFVDEFKTLLSSIKGCRGITLEYVVRDTNTTTQAPSEVPEPDVNDNDILARFATLVGPDFNQDSSSVFTILRVTLTSTPGWNVISSFSRKKDGRGAFIALKAHYQGRSYFELMKTQATTMMTRTFYSGDRAKFTWEKFVDIHLEAHELFTQTGEPLSESMKILNLKNGIRDTAMMEISLMSAKRTLEVTTFNSLRTKEGKMSRRFRTDLYQCRYRRLGGPNARFHTDTLFSKVKSILGDTCAQLYTNSIGYTKVYPMSAEHKAHESLTTFIHQVGIPHELHSDGAKALTQGEFQKKTRKYEIHTSETEPYSPWQNHAERENKIIKKLGRYFMQSTNTPIVL